MATNRTTRSADEVTTAGLFASAAMTDIGRTFGANSHEHAVQMGDRLTAGSGFNQIRQYHGLLIATATVFGGGIWALKTFEGTTGATVLGLLFVIVGSAVALGVGMALLIQFFRYSSLRMRCRLWPVETPNVAAGQSMTGHPLGDTLFITPFKLAAFLMMTPFLFINMIWEVIRVFGLTLIGRDHVSYRGDQGKYYDKVRKEYAKRFHNEGVMAANEYLRIAYSGLLTPIGVEIPPHQWNGGKHKTWLAPMIQRHGPVEKYCTGKPGTASGAGYVSDVVSGTRVQMPNGEVVDTRTYGKVPDKYSGI